LLSTDVINYCLTLCSPDRPSRYL